MKSRSPQASLPKQEMTRWIPAILVIATMLTLGRLCGMDFTWWDDDRVLHQNPLMNPATWETVRYYWTHAYMGLYVPVTYTIWSALAAMARVSPDERGVALNPWIFHSANVLVHCINVILAYGVLKRLIRHPVAAASGALLFAVHPVQVETVGWVSGLKDLLCGTFVLSAIWQYLIFVQENRRSAYWIGMMLMVLGTLSKPTAIVTPLIAAMLDRWVIGRSWREVIRDIWPWMLAIIPCLIWGKLAQNVPAREPIWTRPLVAMDALAFYLGKIIWPQTLTVDYGRNPKHILQTGAIWWTWIFPAIVALVLCLYRKRSPVLVGAALIFVGGLLPILGITPFMFQGLSTVADHYLYLPMLGVGLAVAWVVSRWPSRGMAIAVGIVGVVLIIRSFIQTGVWSDDLTFCRHSVAATPWSFAMRTNYGDALEFIARSQHSEAARDQAIAQLEEAIRLEPNELNALYNLATIRIERGQIDEAIRLLTQAINAVDRVPPEQRQQLGPSHEALAAVLAKRGRYAEAAEQYRLALDYEPGNTRIETAMAAMEQKVQALKATTQK